MIVLHTFQEQNKIHVCPEDLCELLMGDKGNCSENSFRLCLCNILFVHGYHWLPLAAIDLVGDNREFEV